MFNIFKYFRKKDKGITSEDLFKLSKDKDNMLMDCNECIRKNECLIQESNKNYLCSYVIDLKDFDKTKDSILIIDDNPGVLSFLEDDLKHLGIDRFNIIKFHSKYAGFNLLGTLKSYGNLNIKYGIFDLSLGGGVYNEKDGNIVIDGVDVFKECYNINKDMEYFFFTGNTLNTYIKKNQEMIDKFNEITSKDISKYILYKTKLNPDDRREYIKRFLGLWDIHL